MRVSSLLCGLAIAWAARADVWEATRQTVVEPLNSELHRHLPTFLKARELEGVLHHHATEEGTGLTWDEGDRIEDGRGLSVLDFDRDGVGARIRVRTGFRWQTRKVAAGSGFLSGSTLVQHVGLGAADHVDEVEIVWPSGVRTRRGPLAADRRHLVVEGEERASAP
jgi:hypothetical protein